MPLWFVTDGSSFGSITWNDGMQSDVYVYCKETGLFHRNGNMSHSFYTKTGPYRFGLTNAGEAGMAIQNGIGEHGPSRSALVGSYRKDDDYKTVRQVMLTVANERGRV